MKKATLFLDITIFLSILFLFIIIKDTHKKKYEKLIFPKSIVIDNATKDKKIDKVLMILANKVFKYDSIHIMVFPLFVDIMGIILYLAFTQKFPFYNHDYVMFINDKLPYELMKKVLCHEMWHIYQLESKELIETYNKNYIIFKNDTVFYDKIDYMDRPFEKEAFKSEKRIFRKLNNIID